ncbi:MAG: hypothetical protein ABSD75_15845 [Terriglobales bacterium]
MKTAEIVIIGSGSLAQGIVYALSQVAAGSFRVAIAGRSQAKIFRLALLANARAASFGTPPTFFPLEIAEFKTLAFSRALRSLRPSVVLLAASLQSPWEGSQGQNAWSQLIAEGGFGLTLPLQLRFAAELSRSASDSETAIVNACYPDCVNVVVDRLGLRTTCGIGNCAIVEAFCRAHPEVRNNDVRVVGHHGHLRVWLNGETSRPQPRIWVKGKETMSSPLRPRLGAIGEELNQVTSSTATRVVMSLLTGGMLQTSVPGVAGMPGGYPFLLKNRKFTLHLPSHLTAEEAIAHNQTGERLDGLHLASGVKFIGRARRSLARVGFAYAEGFDLAEWQSACDQMVTLRERLRLIST